LIQINAGGFASGGKADIAGSPSGHEQTCTRSHVRRPAEAIGFCASS
jgi:hypothetical protein